MITGWVVVAITIPWYKKLLVSDSHPLQFITFTIYHLSSSSQHKFPNISVTNFHEVPCILSLVISCQHCHFLSSAVISFCCCLLPFPILPLSRALEYCFIVSINKVCHIHLVFTLLDQGFRYSAAYQYKCISFFFKSLMTISGKLK